MGAVPDYAYDTLDRLVSKRYPGDAAEKITIKYDESGRGFAVGRSTTVIDQPETLRRSYDARGNGLLETRNNGGNTRHPFLPTTRPIASRHRTVAKYRRDKMGRVTAITLTPDGAEHGRHASPRSPIRTLKSAQICAI